MKRGKIVGITCFFKIEDEGLSLDVHLNLSNAKYKKIVSTKS